MSGFLFYCIKISLHKTKQWLISNQTVFSCLYKRLTLEIIIYLSSYKIVTADNFKWVDNVDMWICEVFSQGKMCS